MVKKYKKGDLTTYTLGITLTIELLQKRGELVKKVYYHSKFEKGEAYLQIEKLCEKHQIPFEQNDKAFNILSDKENCFVIGEFAKFDLPIDRKKSHIVLVNPANAGNLGTIIRTSVGFGISNLAIIRDAVDIFDPKVIRSSMGSIFHMNFEYFDSFSDYLRLISNRVIYPFMLKGSMSLSDVKFPDVFSLVFGNEATGLSDEFLNYGQSVRIVHNHKIDSLNLPNAVSIALYEATKNHFKG